MHDPQVFFISDTYTIQKQGYGRSINVRPHANRPRRTFVVGLEHTKVTTPRLFEIPLSEPLWCLGKPAFISKIGYFRTFTTLDRTCAVSGFSSPQATVRAQKSVLTA